MRQILPGGKGRTLPPGAILPFLFLFTLFSPGLLQAQLNVNFADLAEPGCYGLPGGSVRAVAVGGTAPYTYTWNTGATGAVLSNVLAGTYSVTVVDAAAAIASRSVTILQPELLTLTFDTQECDLPLGITAVPDGGVGPYKYQWSTGASTATITALADTQYCITVTDGNNCGTVNCITIDYNPASVNVFVNDISCPGEQDGSLTATPTGGTAPFTYLWSNGATTQSITNLGPGSYTVTLTDAKDCTASATGNVAAKAAIEIGLGKTDPTCVGDTNGSISSSVAGGTPPYTYAWSNGATTPALTNLGPGTYTLTVTDANGCPDENSIVLAYRSEISIGVFATPESCPDANDGFLTVTVNNAVSPYSYLWSNGATVQSQSGIAPGNYSVTVTDAVGCQDVASATLNPAPDFVLDITSTDVTICGGANGVATVTVVSGVGPYTYLWSNGATSAGVTGLAVGTYSVTVTNPSNCVATDTVTIAEPPAVLVEIEASDLVCPGENTGTATAIVSGGTAPFIFVWSNGANTQVINGLAAGNYSVTVTDAAGCTDVASVEIDEAQGVNASASGTRIVCGAGNTGTATALVIGGTPPYTFAWNTGASTQSVAGLGSGTYTVTVTDANGCSDEASFTIRVIDDLDLEFTKVDIDCAGNASGSATAVFSGGDEPYSYLWSTGASGATISNLTAGTYSVTVSDANGCSANGSVNIFAPAPINGFLTVTRPLCNGDETGAIDLNVVGGTPPYSYQWSTGATTQDISNLPAGAYGVTITDANDCFIVRSTTVGEPPALAMAATLQDALCNGSNEGAFTVDVSGGTPPYTYLWNTGATTANLGGLTAGDYSLTATDANGCTIGFSGTISEPPLLEVVSVGTGIACNGAATGSVDITVSGGTPPFTYAWSNGATTEDISGLSIGNYSLTVTDFNGCTATTTEDLEEPAGLNVTFVGFDVVCFGEINGSIDLSVSGGTAPYTYAWSNGATTQDISGLAMGSYTVTVTDASSCTAEQSVQINQPPLLEVDGLVTDVDCNGAGTGAIDLLVSGGTQPYTFSWSNGATTEDRAGLPAGSYSVTVTDNAGCTAEETFVIGEPDALSLDPAPTDALCNGESSGSVSLTVEGGTAPYSYSWSNGATTTAITNVPAGTYSVTVTDANNCTVSTEATVGEPTAVICDISKLTDVVTGADGSLEVSASGGTGEYTYLWNTGETTSVIMGLDGGLYSVTVTDANGCSTACEFDLVALSGLGDFVWEDISRDGLQDDNEPPLAGLKVYLKDAEGNVIDSTLTDMNGFYSFLGLQAGTYSVQFFGPDGFNRTQLNAGSDDSIDSDADGAMNGMTETVTLVPGEFNPTLDAGFYNPPAGAITDPCHCLNNATNDLNGQFSEEVLIRSYPGETWRIIAQTNMYLLDSPAPPAAPILVPVGTIMPESDVPGEYLYAFRLVDAFTYTITATNGFDTLAFTNTCVYPTLNVVDLPGPEICISDDPIVLDAMPSVAGTVRFFLNDVEITVLDPAALEMGDYDFRAEFTPDDPDECIVTVLEPIAIVNTCFAKIGDFVWEDINRNGLQDEGEAGISGVPVTVTGVSEPYSDMTTTDETGMYMFLVPPDQSYKVTFGQPEGYNPSVANAGADDTIDSDADQSTHMTPVTPVAEGEVNLTLDAGFYLRPTAEIGDPCTCLNNSTNEIDGQFTEVVTIRSYPGETWTIIAQQNMFLLESPAPPAAPLPVPIGTLLEETDEPGVYEITFKLVDAFTYSITATNGFDTLGYTSTCTYPVVNVEQLPPLEICVADEPIVLSANPSIPGTVVFYLDNEPITVFDPAVLSLGSHAFRVEFTPTDEDQCIVTLLEQVAVVTDCLAKVGDFVWNDRDHDGLQDEGEMGIEGVKVTLTETGVDEPYTAMTTTDATGMYMFQVPAGSYKVTFEPPIGFIPTLQDAGADDAIDSDSDPVMGMTQSVTVSAGEMNLTLDAGFYVPSSIAISDPCTCLNNATSELNGQFSEVLTIRADPGRTWTTLVNEGMYLLSSPPPPGIPVPVPAGTQLVEVEPGVYEYPFILIDNVTYSTIATNGIDTITISNLCIYPTLNVAELPETNICVADDPILLSANPSVPGTVRFFLDGVEITMLDPADLEVGIYEFIAQLTPDNPEECLAMIVLEINVTDECLAKIGDYVWHDKDEDGIQDATEPGIGGVKVTLTEVGVDNPLTSMTSTDQTGMYMFLVPPGDYKVTFEQPENYTPTMPNAGANDAVDSDMDPVTLMTQVVTLSSGEMNLTLDAGFTRECINITNPGAIGFDQYLCGPGNDPDPFVSLAPASGGEGEIEYLWMYSTEDGPFNDATWTPVPNSNSPTYDPGVLYETTRFARCARREGCPAFLETTIVTVLVGNETVAQIFGQSTICVGAVETYQAVGLNAGATAVWDFGPGAQPRTATGAVAHVQFTSFGTFTIKLTVTEDDCSSIATKRIVVTNNPALCGDGFVINAEITDETTRGVMIDWQVVKGNLLNYTIEHSDNGVDFTETGSQDVPDGFTATELQYSFATTAPKQGRNFYRVKVRDGQGNQWFSNVEEVIFYNQSKLALLYPNPATESAILEIFESFEEDIRVELVTPAGRQLQSWEVPAGSKRIDLDLNDLPNGLYLLRLRFGKTNIKAMKLVKY